ncbi:MAG TPA: hypothetical protein VGQ31_05490 [Candidatus Limnocylindrales bacterium]|nr:hypothetical protein [Candidatus Limnocylindrales bacterium]
MPTTIRTGLLAARARGALRPALALAGLVAIAAACSSTGPSASATVAPDGLVALVATADSTSLLGWSATSAKPVPIKLPNGDTTWVATGRADVLAAALANGTTATSDPIHLGKSLAWRTVKAKDASGDPVTGHQDYVAWDPEGGRFATLLGDLLSGDGISVVLVDPSARSAFAIPVDRSVVAAPPVWIGPDRLVVVTGDASSPGATIVDTETGDLSDGPVGARLLAASADGRRVATMDAPGDPVVIRETDAWLGGDGSSIASISPPTGSTSSIAFALDANGQRLVVAWQAKDGSVTLDVYDGRSAWKRVSKPAVGAARGAVVAWRR